MTRHNGGFTLIELLVVLVIIGIVVTLTTLSVGQGRDSILLQDANRLAALLELASDEATLQGRQLGLQFSHDGYRFMFLEPVAEGAPHWLPMTGDTMFKARTFHPAITPQLLLEGMPQNLPLVADAEKPPQVFLFASGERTPFELRLGIDSGQLVYEVQVGPLGTPVVQRVTPL